MIYFCLCIFEDVFLLVDRLLTVEYMGDILINFMNSDRQAKS